MQLANPRITIPKLLDVQSGNTKLIGQFLAKHGFDNIAVYYGEGMQEMLGETIEASLEQDHVRVTAIRTISSVDVGDIVSMAFALPLETTAVIGIGGGKALDAAKYTALVRSWPFICVPTSTANDAFASSNTSLLARGKRLSVHAKMPYGILVDVDVISRSPDIFIQSGVGDLVAKITATEDWLFEERNGKTVVDDCALMISKKAVNSFVRTELGEIHGRLFIKELLDSLTMCGIAMEIAGNSAPASGSEHLMSHAIDEFGEHPTMHGIQVGVATYLMSLVQEHRHHRVHTILEQTGFFDLVEGLGLKRSDYHMAIDAAPSVKAKRFTYLHVEQCRDDAHRLLDTDPVLLRILH